jgi:DNA-directed RNA polymerase subunit M/transcription elongation factor TFIIS
MRPGGGGGKRVNGTGRAGRRKVNYEVLAYNPLNNKLFIKKKNKPRNQDNGVLSGGGGNRAVAKLVRGGISITCPKCPADWQNQLRLGNRVGTIPVVCPGCASNWRSFLPEQYTMTTLKGGAGETHFCYFKTPEGGTKYFWCQFFTDNFSKSFLTFYMCTN